MLYYLEYYRKRYPWLQPVYRKDPIPFTGRLRRRFGHFYRKMNSCLQERRANITAKEFGVHVRPKRTNRYLPDPWDDLPRGDCFNKRSWKKNKKRKQWM